MELSYTPTMVLVKLTWEHLTYPTRAKICLFVITRRRLIRCSSNACCLEALNLPELAHGDSQRPTLTFIVLQGFLVAGLLWNRTLLHLTSVGQPARLLGSLSTEAATTQREINQDRLRLHLFHDGDKCFGLMVLSVKPAIMMR